jgi:hypothetical protein
MVQLKASRLMTIAAILLSPQIVSSCVIFSLNVNYGGAYHCRLSGFRMENARAYTTDNFQVLTTMKEF